MDAYEALKGIDLTTTLTEQRFIRLAVELRIGYLQAIKYEERLRLHRNPVDVAEDARRNLCYYLLRIQNRDEMRYNELYESGSLPGKLIKIWESDKRLKSWYASIDEYCRVSGKDFKVTAYHIAEYYGLDSLLKKFDRDKNALLSNINPQIMAPKNFELKQRQSPREIYLKVHLRDEANIEHLRKHIEGLPSVRRCNVTDQQSGKRNLTVYPQKAFDISEVEQEVGLTLTNYFKDGVINNIPPVSNQAHFEDIQNRILEVLDKAQVSITLAMAWFTNEVLRDKLLEKQKQNVDIRIVIFDDGVNAKHGVDVSGFQTSRIRGSRGGIMHNKFCVVDNQIVITGSYNWSNNAEFKHDENISVTKDPEQATRFSVEFNRLVSSAT